MADMSKFGKKKFPSQIQNHKQWIIDTVRENQQDVFHLLGFCDRNLWESGQWILSTMHKQDRDALLQPNGILTPEQIEKLK